MNTRETARRIIQSRCGGRVERCHGIPHLGGYANSAHSWGVAMLMWYLFPADFTRLVIYCLSHDVPEAWFGDIPAPTLRYVRGMREGLERLEGAANVNIGLPPEHALDKKDMAKLKACDRLEFYLWCREQKAFGNQFVDEAITEIVGYLGKSPLPEPALSFFQELVNMDVRPVQAGVVQTVVSCES